MEIKHITYNEWNKVTKAGDKAIEGINPKNSRIRKKARAQAEFDALNPILARKRPLTNDEIIGRDCMIVYVVNINLGTTRYPDRFKTPFTEPVKISRITEKTVYEDLFVCENKYRNVLALIW